MSSVLDGCERSVSRPITLPLGNSLQCPNYRRLVGPRGRTGHRGEGEFGFSKQNLKSGWPVSRPNATIIEPKNAVCSSQDCECQVNVYTGLTPYSSVEGAGMATGYNLDDRGSISG
jgi:hypothetical protein